MAARNNKNHARRKFIPDIEISGARIYGRPNFSGLERSHNGRIVNSEGNRNFCIELPEDGIMLADGSGALVAPEELIEMGWNKIRARVDADEDISCYWMPIKVNFGNRPPIIWSISGNRRVQIHEDTVDLLDGRNFSRVDLVVHPSIQQDWDTGETNVTAYLAEGFFYIKTSSFEDAWQEEHPEEFEA